MISSDWKESRGWVRWPLLVLAAGIMLVPRYSPSQALGLDRDFAEYLLGRDLVVEATFLGADTLLRKSIGGCGIDLPDPTRSLDLRLRVERVIFGTAEDSILVVSTLGRPQFPPAITLPGARVIAWASRTCSDGWRLWGNMVIITPRGQIVGDYNAQGLFLRGQPVGRPMEYAALAAKLTSLNPQHSAFYFNGKSAVALMKVRQLHRVRRGFFTYECDSLGWLVGSGNRVPHFIDVNAGNVGCEWAREGDSLLVPVPSTLVSDNMALPGCSGAMVVKSGFAPGLGVPLGFLPYALKAMPTGLQVRPIIGRE